VFKRSEQLTKVTICLRKA